jgi:uncharacterized protein (TIGR02598 family)
MMNSPAPCSKGGFSLVEVALALGIAAFCLVPVFGLLPIGLNSNHATFEQTGAANVASAVVADLRGTALITPAAIQKSAYYQIPIPAAFPGSTTFFVRADGSPSGNVGTSADFTQNPHYRVTLYFTSTSPTSASSNTNFSVAVRVLITWPAAADASSSSAPAHFAGSFQTATGLVYN